MDTAIDLGWLDDLSADAKVALLEEAELSLRRQKFWTFFPADGPLRRELYPQHIEFFRRTSDVRELLFLCANRVGKTVAGAYALTVFLTGLYPDWWPGKRFDGPISAWAAGDTRQTTRDIQQLELLGAPSEIGTGMIPGDLIKKARPMPGVADAIDTVTVRHVSGGNSYLGFRSYDQGREAFQGTAKSVIWLDEECKMAVYSECVTRTMTTNGLVMFTFTPLSGLSETVLHFLPGGRVE